MSNPEENAAAKILEKAKKRFYRKIKKLENLDQDAGIGRCERCGLKPPICQTEDGMGLLRYGCTKRSWRDRDYPDLNDKELDKYRRKRKKLSDKIYKLGKDNNKYFCLNCGQNKPTKKDPNYYMYQWPNSFHRNADEEYTCARRIN